MWIIDNVHTHRKQVSLNRTILLSLERVRNADHDHLVFASSSLEFSIALETQMLHSAWSSALQSPLPCWC